MSKITYQQEHYDDIKFEVQPLLFQHWQEIAMYKDKIELEPDWSRYEDLANSGKLHIVTVRDDGELIGYYISIISKGLHYKNTVYGINDILLLKPEYRNAGVGKGLFEYAEDLLKKEGVTVMTVHMKSYQPFDKLCEHLGFDYAERLYTKYIGD